MDAILQGMSHVICYLDVIIVTGTTEAEHLSNVEEILRHLQEHGVRLKNSKYKFFQNSVEYLGHCVDAEVIHTTSSKVRTIQESPTPRNI